MPDYTKRVLKGAGSDLEPDEQVLKSLAGQPPGSLTRGMNETLNIGYGFREGRKQKALHAEGAVGLAASIPPQNVYVTLTDRRLLVHTMSRLGKPEDLAADFRLDQVKAIRFEKKRLEGGSLQVMFSDETGVDLLIVQRQKPEEFLEAWYQVNHET
jgi:hypothetical protein